MITKGKTMESNFCTKKKRMPRAWTMMLVTGIGVGALLVSSCSNSDKTAQSSQPKKKKPMLVFVSVAVKDSISRTIELPGTIRPFATANVLAPTEGKITELRYREGDFVKEHAILGKLSSSMREDIMNTARLSGDASRIEFAERQYRKLAIVSPMQGIVALRLADPGDMVTPRQKIMEIQSAGRQKVEVPVPERELPYLKKSMPAAIKPAAMPGRSLAGRILRIYPRVDERTRTGTVEISLPSAAASTLRTGMFARVSFQVEHADSAVLVPEEALVTAAKGGKTVFVVKGGIVEKRSVTTGIGQRGMVQILQGINVGETIVTAGNTKLKDRQKVRLPKAKPGKKKPGATRKASVGGGSK